MKETVTLNMSINFREPEDGEEPNWLGWFDNKENDYTIYAPNLVQMNELLYPKTVYDLEKDGSGTCRKVIYERDGKRVDNII